MSTAHRTSGGCIHETFLVGKEDGGSVFLKINQADCLPLFAAEFWGLEELTQSGAIRVPKPYALGRLGEQAVLAMEGLDLLQEPFDESDTVQAALAERLAALHEVTLPDGEFGADRDNFLGATPQSNRRHARWADFYVEERLQPQLRWAEARGRQFPHASRLVDAIHTHLDTLDIQPSLVHGDLWYGNRGFLFDGTPVVFDPACHYADPESDLALADIFGGFSPAFYQCYRALMPAPEPVRSAIYRLYHLLNHFHLFGGAYANQAEETMQMIQKHLG